MTRQRGEVVVETRGLCMHFGGVRAVDQVDFTLFDRELRCLIGPNGAGKSTFFKCLTGQLRPSAGEVKIRGQDMTGAEPFEVASLGVGIKTQVPNVFDGLTAEDFPFVHGQVDPVQDRDAAIAGAQARNFQKRAHARCPR